MTLESDIDRLLDGDVNHIATWTRRVPPENLEKAYYIAVQVVGTGVPPAVRIKALALMQALVRHNPTLKESEMSGPVTALTDQIKSTDHPEFQYACARVMAHLLADCPRISEESFQEGTSLLRCLSRTSTFPHSREYLAVFFAHGSAFQARSRQRLLARRLPVWAFIGKLAAPHKQISMGHAKRYGIDWVSFGDYVAGEAHKRGMDESLSVLQALGEELVRDPELLCRNVLAQAPDWQPGLPIVVDGVRHQAVLDALKKLVSPCDVVPCKIDVEPAILEQLLEKKYGKSARDRAAHAATEREVEDLSRTAITFCHFGSDAAQPQQHSPS